MNEEALPKDDSDSNLPGRADESNTAYFEPEIESKSKGRSLAIFSIVFVLAAAGIFSYYFLNQSEIDSQILDNTSFKTLEEKMVKHYGVGQFGSEHAHAALAVFVNGDQLDFFTSTVSDSKQVHSF